MNLGVPLLSDIFDLLAKMIANSNIEKYNIMAKAKDIKFTNSNIYIELIDMFWYHIMLGDKMNKELQLHAGYFIANCFNKLLMGKTPDFYEQMLTKVAFTTTEFV